MVRSFRSKPVGWQHESYRHYLAGKGITTRRSSDMKYFVGVGDIEAKKMKILENMDREAQAVHDARVAGDIEAMNEHVNNVRELRGDFEELHSQSIRQYAMKKEMMMKKGETGYQGTEKGVKIIVEKHPRGEVYPITPDDVKKQLARTSKEDLKGLTAVEFVKPREGEQREAWAQYIRSKRKVLIFSQKTSPDGKIGGQSPRDIRKLMTGYVVPHEIGHHTALEVHHITDKKLATAEARADAAAFGMDVRDKDIHRFEKYHQAQGIKGRSAE